MEEMLPEASTYEVIARRRLKSFLFGISIISLVVLFIYTGITLSRGYTSTTVSELSFTTTLMIFYVGLLLLIRAEKIEIASGVVAVMAAVGMLYYAYGDVDGYSGLSFLYAYPPFIFFLMGRQKGIFWTLLFVLTLVACYLLDVYGVFPLPYSAMSYRDFAASFTIVFGLVYMYQNLVDTSQRLIESRDRQLSEERDRASAVVTSIGEGVMVINRNRQVVSLNPVAEKMLETKSARVIGRDLKELAGVYVKDQEVPDTQRPASIVLGSGRVVIVELEDNTYFKTPSGRMFPVTITASPLKHEGKITGAVMVFRDATEEKAATEVIERKVAERTLEVRQAQAQLEASIESLKIGFIMTNRVPSIILLNTATHNILSKGEQEPLTLDVIDDRFGDHVNLKQAISQGIAQGKSFEFNDIAYGAQFLHVFVTPIKAGDEIIGTVLLLEDVTEAKVIERSKDEFFSIASHELRTPLTAIRGYSSLLLKKFSPEQDKEVSGMADNIHRASIRLIDIVNDFLSTSRLEQHRFEFHPGAFDLKVLAEEVKTELLPLAEKKSLQLNVEEEVENMPLVLADRDRVKEVIINLVGNAFKFTTEGSVTVKVRPSHDHLEVRVVDTGKGVPLANQSLLFRKFQQASTSLYTQDASHGTGLGLYISKLMIEGMGGKITLESSEPGKGTTFMFTLPIANVMN